MQRHNVSQAKSTGEGGLHVACYTSRLLGVEGLDARRLREATLATADLGAGDMKPTKHPLITTFDRWVSDNNVPATFTYGKGWWDYVELVQRFAHKFDVEDVTVVGHYIVDTPPPEERLPLPAVALVGDGIMVAMKWDFGAACRWPREWTVSVKRRSPYLGPTFGLFDPSIDLRGARVDGLTPEHVFGPHRENPSAFTCEVDDEWDVAMLLRFVFYEP